MAWRKQPEYKLVPLKDVRRLTGFPPDEVLLMRDTQKLVRINERGKREELIRIPLEMLGEKPEE